MILHSDALTSRFVRRCARNAGPGGRKCSCCNPYHCKPSKVTKRLDAKLTRAQFKRLDRREFEESLDADRE